MIHHFVLTVIKIENRVNHLTANWNSHENFLWFGGKLRNYSGRYFVTCNLDTVLLTLKCFGGQIAFNVALLIKMFEAIVEYYSFFVYVIYVRHKCSKIVLTSSCCSLIVNAQTTNVCPYFKNMIGNKLSLQCMVASSA